MDPRWRGERRQVRVGCRLAAVRVVGASALLLLFGCGPGGRSSNEPAPAPAAQPPARSSLAPLYRLAPRAEYPRLAPPVAGVPVPLADGDFVSTGTRVSAADGLDALALQLAEERGGAPPDLLPESEDRLRAAGIPFRGNPSDLLLSPDGARLFVPLGGDLMTPGQEVAVVELAQEPVLRGRVRVGARPQRLALHPAGLVFVCNQYSNFVSVLDAESGEPLVREGRPVDVYTDHHCTDLVFAPRDLANPDADAQDLYVANRWRRSVLVYRLEIERGPDGAVTDVVQTDAAGRPFYEAPLREIVGVGPSPSRLSADLASGSLYVTNHRGGTVARIDLGVGSVTATFEAGAPSIDLVRVGGRAYVATLMPDRGLLAAQDAAVSPLVEAPPFVTTGLDGSPHEAHPGALLDETRSYNFEDVRNGLYELEASLAGPPLAYYTDDISPEPNFAPAQKILAGALPQALVANASGDRLYLAFGGSDLVQELLLDPSAPAALAAGRIFATRERPFALALDEPRSRLYVATWGGEVVEVFDLATGGRLAEIDLGYAEPRYPASELELGERWFYGATWSNNGRKSCAHCHFDELVSDGQGFSNGVTAPTALHRVKPNHDLATSDAYFWNGSFANGSYRSLAFASMLRTNCELVLFGLIEGPASDPAARVGDPASPLSDGRDALCRPEPSEQGVLPPNFAGAAAVIAAQKLLAGDHVVATTGRAPDELARALDLYAVSELRLPPNPLRHRSEAGLLPAAERERLASGEALFQSVGCPLCHPPGNERHPYSSGLDRGSGADWNARFAAAYADDPRLPDGLPPVFLDAIRSEVASPDVNVHLDPIDFFVPLCFLPGSCLAFEDPLEPGIAAEEEARRLDLLVRFNLADPQRGFVPGNLPGQVKVNVPSLRGIWTEANLLHHGHARSIREAILAPGHPALRAGERGFAVGPDGNPNTHGATRDLAPEEVDALVFYARSIE